MNRFTHKKYYIVLMLLFLSIIFSLFIFKPQNKDTNTPVAPSVEIQSIIPQTQQLPQQKIVENIALQIIIGDTTLNLSSPPDTSLYDILVVARKNGEIFFEGKNYTGLGFFVEKIGSLTNGNGKNLMYDVNGKEAGVGVMDYKIKDGDIVEWKLK